MVGVVGHYHKEDELGVTDNTVTVADGWGNFLVVVVLDRLSEGLKKDFFMERCLIRNRTNIGILNSNT